MMDGAEVADDLASLTTAVVAGDEDRVQQLLSRTCPSPLSSALWAFRGTEFIVGVARTAEGCDINRRGEGRPLLVAVKCENLAIAQLLIDHGARSMKHRKRSELHALAEVQSGPFPCQVLVRTTSELFFCGAVINSLLHFFREAGAKHRRVWVAQRSEGMAHVVSLPFADSCFGPAVAAPDKCWSEPFCVRVPHLSGFWLG
jgi:hypothetical protein